MNVERLFQVVAYLQAEFTEQGIVAALGPLIDGLNNQINQPQDAHLSQISDALEKLRTAIETSTLDQIPQTLMPIIEEIGFADYVGIQLYKRIDQVIRDSQPLLNEARDKVSAIRSELNRFMKAFEDLGHSLSELEIEPEGVEEGGAELSIVLPRHLFDDDLESFAKESKLVDRLVKLASQVATGERDGAKIKQISSSDPTYFLLAAPPTILFVLKVVNMILEAYERVQNIRKARTQAALAELPAKILKEIEQEAKRRITEDIDAFMKNIVKKSKVRGSEGEKAEVHALLADTITKIAARIDRGMRIEGAAEEVAATEEGQQDDTKGNGKILQQIEELSLKIRYFKPEGEPILSLPPPENERDD